MKVRDYLFLINLFALTNANAQQVVTTAGGYITNNSVQVNWTIGEPITETAISNKVIVSAGFNQLELTVSTSVENIESKIEVLVFPNPTTQYVNIKYDGQLPIKARILSINGTVMSVTELNDQSTQLDFSNNSNGIYLIEITDQSGKSNIYKIVKQ